MQEILKNIQNQLDFCSEINRKATFKTWVFSERAKCSASKLAEAGFIYTGTKQEPDSVKCFFCDKSLDSWDEDDDPWAEHQKHAKNCDFAKMDKPEKSFTISEFIDIRNALLEKLVENTLLQTWEKEDEACEEIIQMCNSLK